MRYVSKLVGYLAWMAAVGLTVYLVWEFTQGQSHVAIGVAILAIVMSAFGLLFARHAAQSRDYAAIGLGLVMWAAGVTYLTTTELGYWTSTYEARYEAYQHEKKARARQEGLSDQAWQALTTGEVPLSAEQAEADRKAKQLDPIYSRSKDCTDATLPDSRAFCAEIFALKSPLAHARQREKFENQIVGSVGASDKATGAMNVFAHAEMLARRFGGTERGWADFLIFSAWFVLMLVRDAGLLVANPLVKRKEALPAVKATPAPWTAYTPTISLQRAPVFPQNQVIAEEGGNTPPDDGGTPVEAAPDEPAKPEEPKTNIVKLYEEDEVKPVSRRDKQRQKRERKERLEAELRKAVMSFVDTHLDLESRSAEIAVTEKGGHASGGTPADTVYRHFRQHAIGSARGLGRNQFGRIIGEFVDRARNSKGAVYGCVIRQPAQKRKAA